MISKDQSLEDAYRAVKKYYAETWDISSKSIFNPGSEYTSTPTVTVTVTTQNGDTFMDEMTKKVFPVDSLNNKLILEESELDTFQATTSFTVPEMKKIYVMKSRVTTFSDLPFGTYASDIIIAGGCFASFYHDQKPKDIDIFILNGYFDDKNDSILRTLNNRYLNSQYVYHDTTKYMTNHNRIKRIVNYDTPSVPYKFQLIFTDYKTRKELLDDFDMLHCCVSYDVMMNKLYITRAIYDAINKKRILSNNGNKIEHWRFVNMLSKGWWG